MDVEPPLIAFGLRQIYRSGWRRASVVALESLSYSIGPGEILGLVGPNGSGKTTAIRCSLGLLNPTSGGARLFGADAGTLRARRGIGYAPENFGLSGRRTGVETLALLGRLAEIPRSESVRRAVATMERLDLDHAKRQPIGTYSKGMLRRLSIAAAIQHDPQLIVLDEPFDGLDPIGVGIVRDEIARRANEGAAVLLSSHALSELEVVATHLLVIDRGRVLEQGAKDEVLARAGLTSLCVKDLTPETLHEVARLIASRGGEVVQQGPARESLEALFRRRVSRRNDDS